MAKDFLALPLGPMPSDMNVKLVEFREKYPHFEPAQWRHREFCAFLDAILPERARRKLLSMRR